MFKSNGRGVDVLKMLMAHQTKKLFYQEYYMLLVEIEEIGNRRNVYD